MELDPRQRHSGILESELHPDIDTFANENGFTNDYRCTVQKWSDNYSKWALCRAYHNKTPNVDEIGQQFGTGQYRWIWATSELDDVTQTRKPAKFIEQVIEGEHWDNLHAEYAAEQEEITLERMRKQLEKRNMRQSIRGGQGGGSMLEMLREAKGLGLLGGDKQNDSTLFFQMMQEQSKQTQTMMIAMMQMVGGANKGMDLMQVMELLEKRDEKTLKLTEKIMDMKSDAEAPEESNFDKIMSMLAQFVPAAMAMFSRLPDAATRREVAQEQLKGSKEGAELLTTLKENPEMIAKAAEQWDKQYGKEKVDELLDAVGLKRPEAE